MELRTLRFDGGDGRTLGWLTPLTWGAVSRAASPCEGSRKVRRWSEKPRGGGVDMAKGKDQSLKTANILPALIHRAIIAFFYNFRKTQKFSHRFQNEIGKEWNNILTFQDKHDQLRVRYKERRRGNNSLGYGNLPSPGNSAQP